MPIVTSTTLHDAMIHTSEGSHNVTPSAMVSKCIDTRSATRSKLPKSGEVTRKREVILWY